MHRHQILGGNRPEKPQASQSAAIEALTGLAQVVIAVVAYLQLNTPRAWWILAIGVVWLVVAFGGRPLIRWFPAWRREKHDERVMRHAKPELRALTRTFGKLVSVNDTTTLQAGLQEAFKNYHGMLERLHVPSVHLFDEMLGNVVARLEHEPPDRAHMLQALDEFYTLVSAHSTQCIHPVFRSMSKDARDLLTPAALAMLNSYRERYIAFHEAFAAFVENLNGSLRASKLHRTYDLFRPDALTA